MINLLVLKENNDHEKRVALVPDEIKKYLDLGFKITIEKDAGVNSGFSNEDYKKHNVIISSNLNNSIKSSDVIVMVQKPDLKIINQMKF